MSEPEPPCGCVGPGACPRYGITQTPHTHRLCQTRPEYRAKWGRRVREGVTPLPVAATPAGVGPPPRPAATGPCRFVGAELTGPERQARGVGHARRWVHCLHPDRPLGDAVCGCRGCGPRCPGFSPDPHEEAATVPDPTPTTAWAYGVTTVRSRRDTYLPRTLASLKAAGFDAPRLFVDGDDDGYSWAHEFGLPVTARGGGPARTAGNWVLALYELYVREPAADRYAVFQDDLVAVAGLREYLGRSPYPGGPDRRAYLNLLTFPSNQSAAPRDAAGRQTVGWFASNQNGRGAVALVFSRAAAVALLSSRHLAERPQSARGYRAIDGGVVEAMRKAGYAEYCHNPSLVLHTGDVSSMGNSAHPAAESFPGERFDARTLLPTPAAG